MNANRYAAALLGLLLASSAHSQAIKTTSDLDVCRAFLANGSFDTRGTGKENIAAATYRATYCEDSKSKNITDQSTSQSGGLNIGLPTETPFDIGISGSNKSANQLYQEASRFVCDDKNSQSEHMAKFFDWSRKASDVIYKNAQQCVATITANSAVGLLVKGTRSIANGGVTIDLTFVNNSNAKVLPTRVFMNFSPPEAIVTCGLYRANPNNPFNTSKELKTVLMNDGIVLEERTSFSFTCNTTAPGVGVEVSYRGLTPLTGSPALTFVPYVPLPLIATSQNTSRTNAVSLPKQGDAVYQWGSDTLLNEYIGTKQVSPGDEGRWAEWKFTNVVPGNYQITTVFAAPDPRPLRLIVEKNPCCLVADVATMQNGETDAGQPWSRVHRTSQQTVKIVTSEVTLRLQAERVSDNWPHFKEIRLVYVGP